MKTLKQHKEEACPNCSRMLPGGYIEVDDVYDPHCIKCGKPILKSNKAKEFLK